MSLNEKISVTIALVSLFFTIVSFVCHINKKERMELIFVSLSGYGCALLAVHGIFAIIYHIWSAA